LELRIETGSKIGSNFGTETKTEPEQNSGTGTRIGIFYNNYFFGDELSRTKV
jgi:hypothetical protein